MIKVFFLQKQSKILHFSLFSCSLLLFLSLSFCAFLSFLSFGFLFFFFSLLIWYALYLLLFLFFNGDRVTLSTHALSCIKIQAQSQQHEQCIKDLMGYIAKMDENLALNNKHKHIYSYQHRICNKTFPANEEQNTPSWIMKI